jgi:hypothetical protein
MNRAAQSFRSTSVTADGAMRNTHMHTQGGVTRWARQDSNLTSENTASDIENAENSDSSIECVAESTAVENKSEQVVQLLALLQGLSSEELKALLKLASDLNNDESNGEIL